MKKQTITKIKDTMEEILIIICIISLVYLTGLFYGSLQTIDTIHNAERLTAQLSIQGYNISTVFDTGSDGISRPILNYYAPAMNTLRNSFIGAIILSLLLGILLSNKFDGTRKRHKK